MAHLDSTGVHRLPTILALLVAATLLAGCQEDSGGDVVNTTLPPAAEPGQVIVKGVAFNPNEVRTAVGESVTWSFEDGGLEHTVTADDGSFDSGRKAAGTFERTFDAPGTVAYHCEVHTRMKGTIVVTG